jgi:hypothetical protein
VENIFLLTIKNRGMKKKIPNVLSIALIVFVFSSGLVVFTSCIKSDFPGTIVKNYPADVAIAWIKMQEKLFIGTPGLLPHVTGRTYAYVGLTLYESIVPGIGGYQSIASQLNGKLILPSIQQGKQYYFPASANAALAFMLKNLLPHATPKLLASVDSLEAYFNTKFQKEADAEALERSAAFGKEIATAIFEWSKTDGGHEVYKSPFSDTYVPPTGPGKWVSTGEFPFSQPVYPYWVNNRTFIPGLAEATKPPPPPAYSEEPGSVFYNAVNEIYTMSQNLSREDSLTAKFWADLVPEQGDVSHAANIVTQVILLKNLSLEEAAVLYCKHGIAGNDAAISCVKTKFHYNLVRPITYIRTILGHSEWQPVIPTPPFPEYTSAHATISMALASVLESTFGKNYAFIDHSFDSSYGPRSFDSFEAYAKEAALSRLQGGIHYRFSMDAGLQQGKKIAEMVNQLRFKK